MAVGRPPRGLTLRPHDAVIDLHTHTDASDGRLTSHALVERAWKAGIGVLGVTDHDTVAGLPAARQAAAAFGLTLIDGVEVTAVERRRAYPT